VDAVAAHGVSVSVSVPITVAIPVAIAIAIAIAVSDRLLAHAGYALEVTEAKALDALTFQGSRLTFAPGVIGGLIGA
jgi:hypothetical protein